MLEENKCKNACCRHWSEIEGNCEKNGTFMESFCAGACETEAQRVKLRKKAFEGDYEKQWEHGMALLDQHDSEGYYWVCRSARRAIPGRESLSFMVGEDEVTTWPLCERDPKKGLDDATIFDEWLEPLKALEGYDEEEIPVLRIIADYIFDGRDDDFKKHGSPVVKQKKAWRISDAPEDNPDQLKRTKLAESGTKVRPPGDELGEL